ncbi:MAG: cytochrome c maturation protein CcmE [Rhodobacteraceae bacterium]|nr:MAG: cytochrome c maturation protein CcmE [Paracoccaceae bacterium]|tara:strand:- start:831 stop:1277 length:447 start_codon:yes stop_codon:yes gene_type:complete
MLSRKRKRIRLIFLGLTLLVASALLVGYAMKDGIEFFKTPSELIDDPPPFGKRFRLGGVVSPGSIEVSTDGSVSFEVADQSASIQVIFFGILPDLFEENQGVITTGILTKENLFSADEVLAKHDENYMPKELVDSLKERGVYVKPLKD